MEKIQIQRNTCDNNFIHKYEYTDKELVNSIINIWIILNIIILNDNKMVVITDNENIDDYDEEIWFDSVKYKIKFPDRIYKVNKFVGNLIYDENNDYKDHNEINWFSDKDKSKHENDRYHYKKGGKKGKGLFIKPKSNVRKKTDNQCTELITALILLGFKSSDFDYDKICNLSNDMLVNKRLKCEKESLNKYLNDLKISLEKKTIKKSYIENFIKINSEIDIDDVDYVYLTGKTYSGIKEIEDLNKDYESIKPNSDVYFKLKSKILLSGISCKQSNECPCTNKTVEDKNDDLVKKRENIFNKAQITKDNFKKHRDKKCGGDGTISKILSTKEYYCNGGVLNEYWKSLNEQILNRKKIHIQRVIDSICPDLPYDTYEYDGKELINTKNRKMKNSDCDIIESEIFCWSKNGPRDASKLWYDFIYNKEILYRLEIRFKGTYFGEGGQPQLFIYKVNKDYIKNCKEGKDKYLNNFSSPTLS